MTLYNDSDPNCAAWLRELIADDHLPLGPVFERSIEQLTPDDISPYDTAHFFAGIGGWPLALQIAGWLADRPVWTGSCPCQPISCAGRRRGEKDERHLWPEFYRLISECRPATIFGEQVASPDGLEWLDGISLDLEEIGYAVGTSDLPAACAGTPHIRQRVFWVAYRSGSGLEVGKVQSARKECEAAERGCDAGGVGDSTSAGSLSGAHGGIYQGKESRGTWDGESKRSSSWSNYDIIPCADGKSRRIESGTFPLAHGIPNRVGLLRGYGNAIVPQIAAEFINAFLEATD